MAVFFSLDQIQEPFRNAVLTIGNFDGVHRGHQSLFAYLNRTAREETGESVVITFHPHPLQVLLPSGGNAPKMINTLDQKIELIGRCGVDHIMVIPFTAEFSRIGAAPFVEDLLWRRLGMRSIVIGHDYAFGYRREGNVDLLREMGRRLGFRVLLQAPVLVDGERVSSTVLRNLIEQGAMEKAYSFLGRYYQLQGTVIPGRKVGGSQLGFPTANLEPTDGILPGQGVYAVRVIRRGKTYRAVCNVGFNPTFGLNRLSVEVYILDFDENIYGEELRVDFVRMLREEKKFSSIDELIRQIRVDVEQARILFENWEKESQERSAVM